MAPAGAPLAVLAGGPFAAGGPANLSTRIHVKQHGQLGFRIVTDVPRPDAALVDRFRGMSASTLADAMGRFHFMDPGIRPRTGLPLCGAAVTVNARPGDNLMVHKALEIARPGDVVVVSTNGNRTSAVFGEIMGHVATSARLGGLIVDGAIRDVDILAGLKFPAFSRSICPGGCDKDGPGEINVAISCGNTVVMPGDIVVGDQDGVAVVPRVEVHVVLARLADISQKERRWIEAIRAGRLFAPEIDRTLEEKGVLTK